MHRNTHTRMHTCDKEVTSDPRNAGVKSLKTWLIEGMYRIKEERKREKGRERWMEGGEGGERGRGEGMYRIKGERKGALK